MNFYIPDFMIYVIAIIAMVFVIIKLKKLNVSQSVVVRIASAALVAVPFWDPEPGFWITKYRRAPCGVFPDWCSWCINGNKPGSAPRVALVYPNWE